jgi:vacuolar-type H+-ATPase subunit H
MQGLELIKNLADLDRELTERVEETRGAADQRIKSGEAESQRLLAEAEAQIHQMNEASKAQIVQECAKLGEDAGQRATAERERMRSQALPNLDRAVAFILSEVMP